MVTSGDKLPYLHPAYSIAALITSMLGFPWQEWSNIQPDLEVKLP